MTPKFASRDGLPSLILNDTHYERLVALAEQARQQAPDVASYLLAELHRARLCQQAEMPDDVVDLHRQVDYQDLGTGERHSLQLVWPADAQSSARRVSVISPIGAALIGLSVGQVIHWQLRDGGARQLKVLAVRSAAAVA
ncbi:nucleoside diphosphate kinase regulator [Flagellatimonas centrodinii]|uniref:nucleoside diphosphate kinase regulator n=1 Tax=Flagellatimonas centrodinii TaxID=2806210 RepID=UPI001FEFE6C1|nr:nucleoside diphosphate kinase regulator [Flagellatimonas centrodinii]ULQ46087.1 nucleoside diphosphate kinase regulator [Flagellatimonas centrodinii]